MSQKSKRLMSIETLLSGESKNVEYKLAPPFQEH